MIQLRPSGDGANKLRRSFLTFYENKSSYRCFQSVYLGKHLCGDATPKLGKSRWHVRGDELVFLYIMPWYFQTPGQFREKIYEDMGKRYKYFLLNG